MNPIYRRLLVWSVLGCAIAGALGWAFWPRAVPVEVAAVGTGPLQVEVSDEGRTRVRETYQVSAPVTGRLLRIEAHAGDAVTGSRTIVAYLQPSMAAFLDVRSRAQAEAAVKSAEAARALAASEVEKAKAQLAFATSDLDRAKRLSQSNAIATVDLERAQLAYNTAVATRNTAEAALQAKEYDLSAARALLVEPADFERLQRQRPSIKLVAPVTGKVLRVLHENEAVLAAGSPILEIGDPKNLEIVVELVSQSTVKIHEGDRARITDWGGPGELAARVRRIEPGGFTKVSALGVEEQRVNVLLDFTGPPQSRAPIADGFRVNAHIVYWEKPAVLRIAVAGLFRNGNGWAAFAVRNGKAALTPVTLGQRNDEFAEVLGGVKAGDLIVIHPSDRVRDGANVTF